VSVERYRRFPRHKDFMSAASVEVMGSDLRIGVRQRSVCRDFEAELVEFDGRITMSALRLLTKLGSETFGVLSVKLHRPVKKARWQ
jgi:hypothetical protein